MLQKGFWVIVLGLLMFGIICGGYGTYLKFESAQVQAENVVTRNADLEFAVPSNAHRLSVQEIQNLNKFFDKVKEFTGVERRSNPITLTGEEFNRIPKEKLNLEIPKSVLFFRSGFYNSAGHTLESQSGVFASQAILYGNEVDADLAEKNLMKMTRELYSIMYRKGNVVGSTNMYRSGEPTKEFLELVVSIKINGFKITKIPPVSEKSKK